MSRATLLVVTLTIAATASAESTRVERIGRGYFADAAWTPDSTQLVTADGDGSEGLVRVWEVASARLLYSYGASGGTDLPRAQLFAHDGDLWFVAPALSELVQHWCNVDEPLVPFPIATGPSCNAAFLPTTKRLLLQLAGNDTVVGAAFCGTNEHHRLSSTTNTARAPRDLRRRTMTRTRDVWWQWFRRPMARRSRS